MSLSLVTLSLALCETSSASTSHAQIALYLRKHSWFIYFAWRTLHGLIASSWIGVVTRTPKSSGGVDFQVYQYDISRLGSTLLKEENRASAIFREYDSIREISCNPFQEEIFISATDGGRITLHDTRAKPASVVRTSRAQDAIQLDKEVTGVQYHPQTEHLFVTSDGHGRVALRDTRMGFGSRRERSGDGVVLDYNMKLSRRDTAHLSNPESSSVTFNADGSQLAVTMLHYYPTLFKLSDPNPLAFFTGRNTPDGAPFPDGQRTYANSCTMKHGSFGGPPDDPGVNYYCAGSDNFCGYLWKIPPVEELISMREEISFHDWYRKDSKTIGFTKKSNSTRCIPHELSTPTAILKGHDSIVNTAVMHPHLPLIATAGIERDIRLHGPTPSAPFMHDMKLTPTEVRQLRKESTQEERDALLRHLLLDASDHDVDDREEQETIDFFDSMLRMDGQPDPFDLRKWVDDDEDSE